MPENFAWEGKPSAASPGHSSKPFTPRAAIKFWEKSGFLMSGYSRIAVINGCYTRKKGIGGVGREYMWHSYEECGPRVLPLRRSFARQCLGSVFPGPLCVPSWRVFLPRRQAPFRSPPQIWIRTRRTMWGRSPTIKEIRTPPPPRFPATRVLRRMPKRES